MTTQWNGRDGDEEHGVGTRDGVHALCQVVNLSGICMLSQWTIRAFAEFGIFGKFTSIRVEGIAVVSSDHWDGRVGSAGSGMESMEAQRLMRSAPGACCQGASDGGGWTDGCRFAIAGMESDIIMGWGRGGHPQRWHRGQCGQFRGIIGGNDGG